MTRPSIRLNDVLARAVENHREALNKRWLRQTTTCDALRDLLCKALTADLPEDERRDAHSRLALGFTDG